METVFELDQFLVQRNVAVTIFVSKIHVVDYFLW